MGAEVMESPFSRLASWVTFVNMADKSPLLDWTPEQIALGTPMG